MRRFVALGFSIALASGVTLWLDAAAMAQRAPSASELGAYQGIHKAAHLNDVEELGRQISKGADVNLRDVNGRTPAHIAAFASNDDIITALAEAGANLNLLENDKYDVVTIAAVANDPALVALAVQLGNDPGLTTSIYDGTALIAAAHLGHHEVVEILIEAGAPLDHVNNLGWTALIEAVILGDGGPNHQATVEALVSAGASVDIGDRNGVPPLEHAQSRGYAEIMQLIRRASDE